MASYIVWKDNTISMVRGDTFRLKVSLIRDKSHNGLIGQLNKEYLKEDLYQLKPGDKVYFGVMEPNKPFEESIIIKYLEYDNGIVREPIIPTGTIDITENGTHDIYNYEYINIDVKPELQNKVIIPSSSSQEVSSDQSFYGLGTVTIEPVPTTSIDIIENGSYSAPENVFYSEINVDVPGEVLPDGDLLPYGDITRDMVGAGQADYMILNN